MTTADQLFPGFVRGCLDIHVALLPLGFCLLILSFATEFWAGTPSPFELVRFIVKLFLIIFLLTRSFALINAGQDLVDSQITQKIPAQPDQVAAFYKEKVKQAQSADQGRDKSLLDRLLGAGWFESIIGAVLLLVAWLATVVMFLVSFLGRIALLLCWALNPLLLPLLAMRPVSHLGVKHILRTVAIILWPIGNGLAGAVTAGLLDNAASHDLLNNGSMWGGLGYGLTNLLTIAVVAIWIIGSSFAAPVIIQKLLVGSPGPAAVLGMGADLAANVGLPLVASATRGIAGWFRSKEESQAKTYPDTTPSPKSRDPNDPRRPPPPMPAARVRFKREPDDPTGEKQVDELLKNNKKK